MFDVRCRFAGFLTAIVAVIFGMEFRSWAATFPSGFTSSIVGGAWNDATGVTFDANGRMYVWEKAGKVWVVENGTRLTTPLLDISDEVGNWRDHGLMSVVLHPNFLNNGYFYLLYVADFHHVAQFGTANYVPTANQYFRATIGRVTRYTARASDGYRTADPTSRLILIGESVMTGLPILDVTHAVGGLAFGADGSLLISCGDAAGTTGGAPGALNSSAYVSQAVADAIITPEENVDSFRSQMVDSLAGKILRIDPATGNGMVGNPFFTPGSPRSARSRVWSLGLRNPFRLAVRPGTGSHDPADGNPGVIYIGDVGWDNWEELDVARGPGNNFGWPLYEGLEAMSDYQESELQNLTAPNPLAGGDCGQAYFRFKDLLLQDSANPLSFPNPCNAAQQIPAAIPKFRHVRPVLDWGRNGNGPARTGIYNGSGNAAVVALGTAGSPVAGSSFKGNCVIGGVWYTGTEFPPPYANTYLVADHGDGWVKSISFDANDRPAEVRDFISGEEGIVCMATNPKDGSLYYVVNGSTVVKVTYIGEGNRPPIAEASASNYHGPGPLTVQFTGNQSTDPEGHSLTYLWNFGDGSATSTAANPSHTFTPPNGSPVSYTVTLTVRDNNNATSQTTLLISVNNTPPNVNITSPSDGGFYSMTQPTSCNLTASVSDSQTSAGGLSYAWQVFLHHNEHYHPEPVVTTASASTVISPIGCDGNAYYYRIRLTVTDPQGLSSYDEVYLYPECDLPAAPSHLAATASSSTRVQLNWHDNSDDEIGFHIERSQDDGPFLNVGTVGPGVTTFVNSDLTVGTTYAYRVAAFNSLGQSPYSNTAEATGQSLPGLPAPWDSTDIGAVALEGGAGYSDGTFIVSASGADITDPNDAFHFAYRTWTGDGVFMARVTGVENTDTWAKAGLMFRSSLAANSAHAFMLLRPLNGAAFQTRASNGGTSSAVAGQLASAPCWLKIERAGNRFTGSVSLDGVEWFETGFKDISMPSTVFVGIALTSHNNSVVNTSSFTNVQLFSPHQAGISLVKMTSGMWELTIQGEVGVQYRSEYSTNLTSWVPFSTNLNSSGEFKVYDSGSSGKKWRFYRVVPLP